MSKPSADQFVYIFHSVTTVGNETTASCLIASLHEAVAHQEGCKKMLQDLRGRFGDPKPLASDDDLADPSVFNNHQMLAAFDCYKNADRFVDGPNKGQLRMSWTDRYRRIDAIYEKLRSDKPNEPRTYYYLTKQKLSVPPK